MTKQTKTNNESNNKQLVNNNRPTAIERTTAEATGDLNPF